MRNFKTGAFGGAFALLGLSLSPAYADPAACKKIADAMMTNAQTPYHSIGTIAFESMDLSGGSDIKKSTPTETIFTGKDIFVLLPSGKWQNVHAALDNVKALVHEAAASFNDCQRLADDTVDGKTLAVYGGRAQNGKAFMTTKVWVAPDRGVLVRSETETTVPEASGEVRRQTLALRYDYDNVAPPTDLQ